MIPECATYLIMQISTGRCYFGGSRHVFERWGRHLRDLRNGAHHCATLQAAFLDSTDDDFVFEIVEECSSEELPSCEQKLLDHLRPDDFNISLHAVAGNMITRHPDRDAILARRLRTQLETIVSMTPQQRKQRWGRHGAANGMFGRKHSDEVRRLLSQRLKGKPSAFKGKKHSDRSKALMSEAAAKRTGSKNPFFGKTHSEETRARIAQARKGSKPPNQRAVVADGVTYESVASAARELGVSPGTICFRIKSGSFDYQYVS